VGTREESNGSVLVRGTSGKIRPQQTEGGSCHACGDVVFVEATALTRNVVTDRVTYVHYACEPPSARPEELSNVIPVGGRES